MTKDKQGLHTYQQEPLTLTRGSQVADNSGMWRLLVFLLNMTLEITGSHSSRQAGFLVDRVHDQMAGHTDFQC